MVGALPVVGFHIARYQLPVLAKVVGYVELKKGCQIE